MSEHPKGAPEQAPNEPDLTPEEVEAIKKQQAERPEARDPRVN